MSSPVYSVAQSAGSVTLSVARAGAATSAVSVAYATAGGTAVAGTDYVATSGTLQWAENDSTPKQISVPLVSANPFAGNKSFNVMLTTPSAGASIGNPGSATVMVAGDAAPAVGDLQFSAADYSVAEGAGTVTIVVDRTGGSSGAISVAYATADGTATAASNYTATSGTLQWADGDSTPKSFSVPVSNTTPFSGSKTFTVALSNATSGATLGAPDSATVTISGDAVPPVGSLQLGASSYSIGQSGGSLTVSVDRVGGSNGAVSVSYATTSGSAVAGTDFTSASGTLQWANGDDSPKSFTVAISNATPFSGSKTFGLVLSSPSTGATITSPGSATVTISGDATPPVGSLELSAASYAVAQNAGTLTVSVERVGGSSGAASVAYATTGGTAVAGTDFTTATGRLQWADGDASAKSFTVAISNATPFSGTKSFTISLSNASTGAAIGSPSSAIASITGDAVAAVGSLQLSAASYTVAQSAGSLSVTVNRTGGSSGAVGVAYATANGTAIAGTDYTATSGTLQWADGDAASKHFSIPVSNATAFSGSKTFSVALSNATNGATLSSPSSATVSITGSGAGTTSWVYYNGVFDWPGDWSSNAVPDYQDTSGDPIEGPYDIKVTITPESTGLWQPYINGFCQTNVSLCFVTTPYQHLIFSLKPTVANALFGVAFFSSGDTPDGNNLGDISAYCSGGSNPPVGEWESCSIPMSAFALQIPSIVKFFIQDQSSEPVFYVDNVGFTTN